MERSTPPASLTYFARTKVYTNNLHSHILLKNGVSKRNNCTFMDMAISMLKEKGLPNTFWDEAIYTAVYILNKCPTKAVQDNTPIEAWNRKKPPTNHLRVFGYICYIHIPYVKRHKLEDKTIQGIFLGYNIIS